MTTNEERLRVTVDSFDAAQIHVCKLTRLKCGDAILSIKNYRNENTCSKLRSN